MEASRLALLIIILLTHIQPAAAHLDRARPLAEHLLALLLRDVRLEDDTVLLVDVLQLVKLLPNVHGEARRDGRAQGRRFAHRGTVDRDTDDVGLRLKYALVCC